MRLFEPRILNHQEITMRTSLTLGLNLALIVSAGLFASGCKNNASDRMATDSTATGTDTSAVTTPPPDTSHMTPSADTSARAGMSAMSDANIMAEIWMADSCEVAEGKLAQGKAKSADVKKFASMMVTEHTKMMADDKALATKTSITPAPPAGDNMKAESDMMMKELNAASGAAFDSTYIAMAVSGHQKMLDMLNQFKGQAKNADLVAAINKAIPVVQKHLDAAKDIQGKLPKSTASAPAADTTKKM
jgi:putative membrane protein